MPPDACSPEAEPTDLPALRKRARFWCSLWAGCGFGILGYPILAALGSLVLGAWLGSMVWLSLELTGESFWLCAGLGLLTLVFWLAEYIALGRIQVPVDGNFFRRWSWLVTLGGYLAIAAVLVVFFQNVGFLKVSGDGMAPTLVAGEWVLYRKEKPAAALQPPQIIIFRTSKLGGEQWLAARVLAAPGERILRNRDSDHYVINGRVARPIGPLQGFQPALVISYKGTAVPPGCYFICQDNGEQGPDSQVFGWVKPADVISLRMLRFSSRGWGVEVH